MNNTLAKVYGAIIAIPLSAILLAGALGGGSESPDYDDHKSIDISTISEDGGGVAGSGKSEAEAYQSLGKYNPCLFIACEGE